jgi:DNA repair exonuclease SbcCD nuclease subunit
MDFSFLHAADLHLGSPFVGLASVDEDLADLVSSASRRAFTELISQAIDQRVRFVVIAGDIYDGDWKDTTIGHFFNREISRLIRAGIGVYLSRGNHDAESVITKAVTLPPEVETFSSRKPQTFEIPELNVALHGQSFSDRAVSDNLALSFPQAVPGRFNIGVLHTNCGGRKGHQNYAPCSVEDLAQRGYQYWALGHVHEYEVLNTHPHIVFSGNLQGRNIRECGRKGALIVNVQDGEVSGMTRLLVDQVRWTRIHVDLTGIDNETAAIEQLRSRIKEEVAVVGGPPVVFRINVSGETDLHRTIRSTPGWLKEEILAAASHCSESVWLESLEVETSEPLTLGSIQATSSVALDLKAMLMGLTNSQDVLRAAVDPIRQRFSPMQVPEDLFSDDAIEQLAKEARELLLSSDFAKEDKSK